MCVVLCSYIESNVRVPNALPPLSLGVVLRLPLTLRCLLQGLPPLKPSLKEHTVSPSTSHSQQWSDAATIRADLRELQREATEMRDSLLRARSDGSLPPGEFRSAPQRRARMQAAGGNDKGVATTTAEAEACSRRRQNVATAQAETEAEMPEACTGQERAQERIREHRKLQRQQTRHRDATQKRRDEAVCVAMSGARCVYLHCDPTTQCSPSLCTSPHHMQVDVQMELERRRQALLAKQQYAPADETQPWKHAFVSQGGPAPTRHLSNQSWCGRWAWDPTTDPCLACVPTTTTVHNSHAVTRGLAGGLAVPYRAPSCPSGQAPLRQPPSAHTSPRENLIAC